ncbi:pirin family protein [Marinomonas pollencensis]|uniref:Redox-sensitive bicupin YhaK (Pirin superfamily) n=1 Tax=Marinomonas pollencensis TaxID=491954 RepID=A0A3E0DMF0_9GAMM|nr:pirin-like C-terminal cupin domain-containing protein [Marinomonas pollencensis]REG83292.1 hypothetical protein DFP81_106152 [Marinomonas pollencensis]
MKGKQFADCIGPMAGVAGNALSFGRGFTGLGFRHTQYSGAMDPIIMVDHYTMTSPTFGEHPHAGLSAISVIFEDAQGCFHNRDSLGNDIDLQPGDLYWLNAGGGVVHDEVPRDGAKIHGLQIFVNLPSHLRCGAPSALHVKKASMPILKGHGYRVRLVLGDSNLECGVASPIWPFTILDGFVNDGSDFAHQIAKHSNLWLYSVAGGIEYQLNGEWVRLKQSESIALTKLGETHIKVRGVGAADSHFVILSGEVINEPFVQRGPFVMSTEQQLDEVIKRYQRGEFGGLDAGASSLC